MAAELPFEIDYKCGNQGIANAHSSDKAEMGVADGCTIRVGMLVESVVNTAGDGFAAQPATLTGDDASKLYVVEQNGPCATNEHKFKGAPAEGEVADDCCCPTGFPNFYCLRKGTKLYGIIPPGAVVALGDPMDSAGDGTLVGGPGIFVALEAVTASADKGCTVLVEVCK